MNVIHWIILIVSMLWHGAETAKKNVGPPGPNMGPPEMPPMPGPPEMPPMPSPKDVVETVTPKIVGLPDPKEKDPKKQMESLKGGPGVQFKQNKPIDDMLTYMRNDAKNKGANKIKLPNIEHKVLNRTVRFENGTVQNTTNCYRQGDVTVTFLMADTKFKSAISCYNVAGDMDLAVEKQDEDDDDESTTKSAQKGKGKKEYVNGHLHFDVDNTTSHQVFKFNNANQDLTLDEYELTMGETTLNVTGLDSTTRKGAEFLQAFGSSSKDTVLKAVSAAIKTSINAALKAAKEAFKAAATSPKG